MDCQGDCILGAADDVAMPAPNVLRRAPAMTQCVACSIVHADDPAPTVCAHCVRQFAWPFNAPVEVSKFPDYPTIVTRPMDFKTVRSRQSIIE